MEGLHVAGLEPAPLDFSAERSLAIKLLLLMVVDNQRSAAHRNLNGQEAGICTRTVSFTGRDAAFTPQS